MTNLVAWEDTVNLSFKVAEPEDFKERRSSRSSVETLGFTSCIQMAVNSRPVCSHFRTHLDSLPFSKSRNITCSPSLGCSDVIKVNLGALVNSSPKLLGTESQLGISCVQHLKTSMKELAGLLVVPGYNVERWSHPHSQSSSNGRALPIWQKSSENFILLILH